MRRALQAGIRAGRPRGRPKTIPAPVGGWNTRDLITAMPPGDAALLDNFIAYPGEVKLRRGSANHATGFPATKLIQSLLPYHPKTGTGSKLFAATNAGIYDATAAGAIGASVASCTNAQWQHVNYTNSANSWLIAVNGTDDMKEYDGTTWTTVVNLSAGFLTNILIGVEVYQQRLYFVPSNELAFWYLPTGSVTGTAVRYNLGQICRRGGRLQAIGTWTMDAGEGTDDHLVAITSEGEVCVFKGTDPADPANWTFIGNYFVGKPLGRRCLTKHGGDLLMILDRGVFPISKSLQSKTVDSTVAITDKIEPTFVNRTLGLSSTFGWEICINTAESYILVNVPSTENEQFVMASQNGSWSRFLGWNAECFSMFNGNLYYGTLEKVVKASSGASDVMGAIQGDIVPAFNYFGDRLRTKHIDLIRCIFTSDGPFSYSMGACLDYVIKAPTVTVSASATTASLWDVALWDGALWAVDYLVSKEWRTLFNVPFFCFTPYIRVSSSTVRPSFIAVDYSYSETTNVL